MTQQLSAIMIGSVRYNVLKVDGDWVLLQWFECSGTIEKTRWVQMLNRKAA